jgi:hypothetical protein
MRKQTCLGRIKPEQEKYVSGEVFLGLVLNSDGTGNQNPAQAKTVKIQKPKSLQKAEKRAKKPETTNSQNFVFLAPQNSRSVKCLTELFSFCDGYDTATAEGHLGTVRWDKRSVVRPLTAVHRAGTAAHGTSSVEFNYLP